MVAEITPMAFSTIRWRYFLVFACTNFFLILPCKLTQPRFVEQTLMRLTAVYLFFPETNGLHLEEVDQIFRESKSALHPVKVARGLPRNALLDGRDAELMKCSSEAAEHRE
jgi:hypothetical protein